MHPHLTQVFLRLDQARATLRASVDVIPAGLHQQRPAPERWSVAEVIEHLALVEAVFIGRIAGAIDSARAGLGPEGPTCASLPETFVVRMADRVNKRNAPDAAQPTGTLDVAAGWAAVEANHQRLRGLVGSVDGLALSQVTVDHPVFGSMTVYQWVELMAAHEGRHTEQIKEVGEAFAASGQR
jgi:hypothetical protein